MNSRLRRWWTRLGGREAGSAAIEVAILAPSLLLILALIIAAGRMEAAGRAVETALPAGRWRPRRRQRREGLAGPHPVRGARRGISHGRFLAAELAHNAWSEHLTVTLVGFGAKMAALNRLRLHYTEDLAGAVAGLRHALDRCGDLIADYRVGVLDGRLRDGHLQVRLGYYAELVRITRVARGRGRVGAAASGSLRFRGQPPHHGCEE